MPLDLPIVVESPLRYNGGEQLKTNGHSPQEKMDQSGYLRVPVWVIVLLITIAGGLILNGAATVYWAATFRQSFQDFKEETYKQKIEHFEAEIFKLNARLAAEEKERREAVELLTEREQDTRNKMARRGIY